MLAAIDQNDDMMAAMGEDLTTWRVPIGYCVPNSKSDNQAGMDAVAKRRSVDQIKAMLDRAVYAGERIVFMHPTDQLIYHALSTVAVDSCRKLGLNIDDQPVDPDTILQRRNSKAALDKGG